MSIFLEVVLCYQDFSIEYIWFQTLLVSPGGLAHDGCKAFQIRLIYNKNILSPNRDYDEATTMYI